MLSHVHKSALQKRLFFLVVILYLTICRIHILNRLVLENSNLCGVTSLARFVKEIKFELVQKLEPLCLAITKMRLSMEMLQWLVIHVEYSFHALKMGPKLFHYSDNFKRFSIMRCIVLLSGRQFQKSTEHVGGQQHNSRAG